MSTTSNHLYTDVQPPKGGLFSPDFLKGMGKVISLNARTDFSRRIASLRLSEQQVLAKDLRRIGKDMWTVIEG